MAFVIFVMLKYTFKSKFVGISLGIIVTFLRQLHTRNVVDSSVLIMPVESNLPSTETYVKAMKCGASGSRLRIESLVETATKY